MLLEITMSESIGFGHRVQDVLLSLNPSANGALSRHTESDCPALVLNGVDTVLYTPDRLTSIITLKIGHSEITWHLVERAFIPALSFVNRR